VAHPVVVLAEAGGGKVKTTSRLTVLVVGMAVAALTAALVGIVTPAHSAPMLPQGFTDSPVVSGLTNPTDMEFAPDGRLFVTEDAGRLSIAKPDGTLSTFLNISTKVDSKGERGLLALTFDPAFSTNHYVYIHYTKKATSTTPPHNRVVRVTASGDRAVSGSEKLIFRLGNQSAANQFPQFMGGALDFGKDGKLYVATGDNDTPDKAQKLTNLFGKMLRINKDGTIPTDNPFYSTASGNNRAIWARGLRNPFKFAIQPGTGTIFINDVGHNDFEEINQGPAGANYGWPVHEGVANDLKYVNPIFAYGHGSTETTGCAITGGAFYNPATDPATAPFPPAYEGDYFFADFCSGWIRTLEKTADNKFTASGFATGLERPIDLEVSKAGELYYLSRSSTGIVGKIGYSGGNP
jgi:glucose/arabinose dehydrogenase